MWYYWYCTYRYYLYIYMIRGYDAPFGLGYTIHSWDEKAQGCGWACTMIKHDHTHGCTRWRALCFPACCHWTICGWDNTCKTIRMLIGGWRSKPSSFLVWKRSLIHMDWGSWICWFGTKHDWWFNPWQMSRRRTWIWKSWIPPHLAVSILWQS